MGHGIAEFFAMNGYPVNLYEPYEPMRLSCLDTIKGELEFLAENELIKAEALDIEGFDAEKIMEKAIEEVKQRF